MASREDCQQPEEHPRHLCQLKRAGRVEEIARRSSRPAFICFNCGSQANRAVDLCNPGGLPDKSRPAK